MSSSIPSWQILTAHAQPFRGARDLAFCLKVPLDSLLLWASSEGSGETARMRRLAWTFAARIGYKYQIRLTRSKWNPKYETSKTYLANHYFDTESTTLNAHSKLLFWLTMRTFHEFILTVDFIPTWQTTVSNRGCTLALSRSLRYKNTDSSKFTQCLFQREIICEFRKFKPRQWNKMAMLWSFKNKSICRGIWSLLSNTKFIFAHAWRWHVLWFTSTLFTCCKDICGLLTLCKVCY